VLVLDKGAVVEYGPPYELIRKEKGMFRGMCETSGEFDVLLPAAKKAFGEDTLSMSVESRQPMQPRGREREGGLRS
jgi:hypothetical protein